MASFAVREALRARVATVMPGGWVFHESVATPSRPSGNQRWWTLTFPGGRERQASIGSPGSNRFIEDDTVGVHLFVPLSDGKVPIESAADAVRAGLRGWRSGFIRIDGVDPPDTGISQDIQGFYEASFFLDVHFENFG